ncbi:MAG TPA: IS110 family transposase, partial [Microvirga sp.]|nr:IS110 family transposase [Microvirga sp.]
MSARLDKPWAFASVRIDTAWLDLHLHPSGEYDRFTHDGRGIARLVGRLADEERVVVVIEAAGGLERTLVRACRQADI